MSMSRRVKYSIWTFMIVLWGWEIGGRERVYQSQMFNVSIEYVISKQRKSNFITRAPEVIEAQAADSTWHLSDRTLHG